MGSEKFCLRWNDFQSNITNALENLRSDKDFFDVTLACEDEQIQAHKVILSACSPFFRNVLRRNPHQNPLLYLKGVKYTDIQAVLNFMYHGEVNVAQDELNSFLSVAEDLKVKGLTQNNSDLQDVSINNKDKQKPQYRHPPPPLQRNVPPPTQKHKAEISNHKTLPPLDEDVVEEAVHIKSEPRESQSTAPTINIEPAAYNSSQAQNIAPMEQSLVSYQDEAGYEDYAHYGEDHQYGDVANFQGVDGEVNKSGKRSSMMEDEFENFFKSNSALVDGGAWSCFLCGKIAAHIGNMRQHFEAHHFSLGAIQCEVCEKIFKTKHSLATHMSKVHRDRRM